MDHLPTVNAFLNCLSASFLLAGYLSVRRGRHLRHRQCMTAALVTSGLFFVSYTVYHANVGSVPYPHHDWTRPLYFTILLPHVLLAAGMVPFILIGVSRALAGRLDAHRSMMRRVWPVWMFVSVSGVVIYLMLYRL